MPRCYVTARGCGASIYIYIWMQKANGVAPCFEVRPATCDDPARSSWETIDLDEQVYEEDEI